jgi:hypothetical protein
VIADIVPALAAASGIPPEQADADFTKAYGRVLKVREGAVDSRTFYESVLLFRSQHPFAFSDLHLDRKTYAALSQTAQ